MSNFTLKQNNPINDVTWKPFLKRVAMNFIDTSSKNIADNSIEMESCFHVPYVRS